MVRDIEALVATGVQGVVFGALDSGGKVDISANSRLIAAAGRAETIFHRAIDTTPDPLEALAAIIALGFTRVLTSGGAPDAVAGAVALRRMYELADGRIELMPGGGMRPHNLAEFLRQVPADQIHLGPFRRVGQHSGAYGNGYMVLDEDVLAETIHCARNLESQPW
jgi:copper homeostasis protein